MRGRRTTFFMSWILLFFIYSTATEPQEVAAKKTTATNEPSSIGDTLHPEAPHTTPKVRPPAIAVSTPWYDVTFFGAVCDGVTDNTTAFTNARNAALSENGILYIPPCPKPSTYVVNLSAFSNSNGQVWLQVVDGNDLTISGGSISGFNVAIFGRGNQHVGASGVFITQPHVDWVAAQSVSPLDVNGISQAWFEGIFFFNGYGSKVPAVSLHTNTETAVGVVYVTFKGDHIASGNCAVTPAFKVAPQRSVDQAGFGMFFSGTSFECYNNSNSSPAAEFENYMDVDWSGPVYNSFIGGGVALTLDTNPSGSAHSLNWRFENILGENLGAQDFFTFRSTSLGEVVGVTFDDMHLADGLGPVYLFGAYGNGAAIGVTAEKMSSEAGYVDLVDPASTAYIYGTTCINAPGCTGVTVGSNQLGIVSIDPFYGEDGHGIYFGSRSHGDPALTLDSPDYKVALRVKQGLAIGSYPAAMLPSASQVGPSVVAIITDSPTYAPGICTGGGDKSMIAVSNGTEWYCH